MFSEDILRSNLQALERAQSFVPFFGRLDGETARAVADDRSGLRIELKTAAGDWVPLHGADPIDQARREIDALGASGDLLVVGAGLGYVLDALEQTPSTSRILAIE